MKAYSYYIKETILPTAISRQRVMRWGFLQLSRAILRTLMLCCFGLLTMTVLSYIRKFHHINTNIPEQTTCPLGVPVEAGEKFYFADMYAGLHSCGVGNIIFEYLAFVGMANELNRTPAVDIKNERLVELLTDWRRHFPNLLNNFVFKRMFQSESTETIKVPLHSCCDSFDVEDVYAEAQDVQSVYTTLVYMQSFVYFQSFTRDEILKLLQFSESTMVDARLRIVDPVNLVGTHNLCVHIRRGDFVNSTIHSQSTEPFTIGATLYLVEKLRSQQQKKNVSVIILGTDPLWEQKLFENTTIDFPFYVANQSKDFVPHVDWAFSKLYCDAVLITASASTYGWWLAYFSRGQNVYYNEHISPPGGVVAQMYQETFFPQEWTRLRLDQTTQQISEVDDWVQDKKMLQRILRKSAKARSKQRSTPNATTVAG